MIETAYNTYLRLREDWQVMLDAPNAPIRSAPKDALFDRLTRAWNRLSANEKRCAGAHSRMVYPR